jgi:hypothetical protein
MLKSQPILRLKNGADSPCIQVAKFYNAGFAGFLQRGKKVYLFSVPNPSQIFAEKSGFVQYGQSLFCVLTPEKQGILFSTFLQIRMQYFLSICRS